MRGSIPAIRDDLWRRRKELLELLETITKVETHASQREGVEDVAILLLTRLQSIGFEYEVVPQPGEPAGLEWFASLMSPGVDYRDLADSYIARRSGAGSRSLLLLGDLDTAFPPGSTLDFPFYVDGPVARGPGVADMKGGLVVLVAALEAIHRQSLPSPPITVVFSGDEQAGSLGSRKVIEAEATDAHWCLCVECARQGGRLMGARGQVGVGRLSTVGREAYGGDPLDRGVNAIEGLSYLIPAIQQHDQSAPGVMVSVNLVAGGRRRSVIPSYAEAVIDIRAPSQTVWDEVTQRLRETAVEQSRVGDASLLLYSHRPAVEWTEVTERMLRYLRRAGQRVGVSVDAIRSPAAGSSAFAASQGAITFDGLGPVGGGIMTTDEHVVVDSLAERAALLAAAISGLPESF